MGIIETWNLMKFPYVGFAVDYYPNRKHVLSFSIG